MYTNHPQFNFALVSSLAIAMCLVVIAPGCSKGDDPIPVPTSPDGAMAEWRKMMETPSQSLEDPNLKLLAINIGQTAPQYVDEMIAELEDPELSGDKFIALVASLEEVVSPDSVPRLVEFTEPSRPSGVRRAATHLLGVVSSEKAKEALLNLKDDEMETVRLTALLGLAQQGEQSVRQDLRDIYRREDVTVATRERIVLTLCYLPIDGDRTILEDAIRTDGFEQGTYLQAVSVIGRIGTTESISALNALKERPDCSVGVREMCDNTIAAIEERFETASASPS